MSLFRNTAELYNKKKSSCSADYGVQIGHQIHGNENHPMILCAFVI